MRERRERKRVGLEGGRERQKIQRQTDRNRERERDARYPKMSTQHDVRHEKKRLKIKDY